MLPIKLLFYPPAIIRKRPDREWRDVTLWLKWGILISLASILIRIAYVDSPADYSYIFSLLDYLEAENDDLTLGFPLKFGLFFLVEIFMVVIVWLLRSILLIIGYRMIDGYLLNNNVAFSIAGASMVNGIWILIPGGWTLSIFHGLLLISYLTSNIHRLSFFQAVALSLLPGLIPFFY